MDYQGQLRYYISGGGTEERFRDYWTKNKTRMTRLKSALENETYVSPGGSIMYMVAGRK